jgi:hypothetical protein
MQSGIENFGEEMVDTNVVSGFAMAISTFLSKITNFHPRAQHP